MFDLIPIKKSTMIDFSATAAAFTLAVALIPSSTVGVMAGVGAYVTSTCVAAIYLSCREELEQENEYVDQILDLSLMEISVLRPLAEEVAFRGILTEFMRLSAHTILGFEDEELAAYFSIAVSAVCFGVMHRSNSFELADLQALLQTGNGVVLGLLAENYGIEMSILAHMVNNLAMGAVLFSLDNK